MQLQICCNWYKVSVFPVTDLLYIYKKTINVFFFFWFPDEVPVVATATPLLLLAVTVLIVSILSRTVWVNTHDQIWCLLYISQKSCYISKSIFGSLKRRFFFPKKTLKSHQWIWNDIKIINSGAWIFVNALCTNTENSEVLKLVKWSQLNRYDKKNLFTIKMIKTL